MWDVAADPPKSWSPALVVNWLEKINEMIWCCKHDKPNLFPGLADRGGMAD